MNSLHPQLRNQLERAVIKAREIAEKGAGDALNNLGVNAESAPAHLDAPARAQRVKLRAEMRRLGGFADLRAEVAYETWHKMLFARFLLNNNLLIYEGFAVSADDLNDGEVQTQYGVGTPEQLEVALATAMLPGLFDGRDPSWKLDLPAETRVELGILLAELNPDTFGADDALGWVYQYWQSARKAIVNAGGGRVAPDDVPAVTQLFTEPYMVEWLLDQTLAKLDVEKQAAIRLLDPCCGSGHFLVAALGRICAARQQALGESAAQAARGALTENLWGLELDARCVQLAGFALLLSAWKRGGYDADLRPNVACCGLAASGSVSDWTRLAGRDGGLSNALFRLYHLFQQAPVLGSLIDPRAQAAYLEWEELEPALQSALQQFGGEADPVEEIFGLGARALVRAARILAGRYDLVITNVPYLARGKHNAPLAEFCAQHYPRSKADLATVFLERGLQWLQSGGQIALVTPQNWLFLGSYAKLREHLLHQVTWKALARLGAGAFSTISGEVVNVALMSLQKSAPVADTKFAGVDVSAHKTPAEKARALGTETPVEVSQAAQLRNPDARITLEAMEGGELLEKYAIAPQGIKTGDDGKWRRYFWEIPFVDNGWELYQSTVADSQDFGGREYIIDWSLQGEGMPCRRPLNEAVGNYGIAISQMRDLPVTLYNGQRYDSNVGPIVPKNPEHLAAIWCFCSSPAFNEAVRRIDQALKVTNASLVKVPFDLAHWTGVARERYPDGLPLPYSDDPTQWLFDGAIATARGRGAEATLQVAVARLLGYRWPAQTEASGATVTPAPEPAFVGTAACPVRTVSPAINVNGEPANIGGESANGGGESANGGGESANGGGITVAEPLVGEGGVMVRTGQAAVPTNAQKAYNGSGNFADLSALVDRDGIVCLPACNGELEAAARLRALLFAALPNEPNLIEDLLDEIGASGQRLDEWLRDGFWKSHCKMFGNRPFVWHIWDGHKNGFAVLVNAHTLDRLKLDKLIYTYLGDYIAQTKAAAQREEVGASARLTAANALKVKLEGIAAGEAPFDIYVRWKSVTKQAIGWAPDINDGVRINIRPWVQAEVLRAKFTVNWNKDRGKNPDGSERLNDVHLTLAEKRAARERNTSAENLHS